MDKINSYKNIIRNLLSEIAENFRKSNRWEVIEAFDEQRGQYILFTDGWQGEKREYGCFMHIEVSEKGKIWLRRDGTDLNIGQLILDEQVPKSDLVLAFHSPKLRAMTEFAVA